jgi:ribosomal protein S9
MATHQVKTALYVGNMREYPIPFNVNEQCMTEQSPEQLSDIEILDILKSMKNDKLNVEANQIIRDGGKAGRQEAHKQALVALHQSFEEKFVEAVTLALHLNSTQAKKIRYKKDRIRILKAQGIDYLAIDGAETAQVLAQIAQAITREDATVTEDLHNVFPFWKQGWPMVQFDNAYKILEDDILIHYQAVLEALLEKY